MNLAEQYFARTQRLMPVIAANHDICDRIQAVFNAMYALDDDGRRKRQFIWPEGVIRLGEGTVHGTFGLEASVTDPLNGQNIPLALKLKFMLPYFSESPLDIEGQLMGYERAFELEKNPPYFVGAVQTPVENRMEPLLGLLMEDVSNGRTLEMIESKFDKESVTVVMPDGRRVKRFIDPDVWGNAYSKRYTGDSVLLDLAK